MSETGQMNVVEFPQRKCCQCGARATVEVPIADENGLNPSSKWFCADHGRPLTEIELCLLVDVRDAELTRLQQSNAALVKALTPFAKIADEYNPAEDDSHELWKDCDQAATRVTLGQCRVAKSALAQSAERTSMGENRWPITHRSVGTRLPTRAST